MTYQARFAAAVFLSFVAHLAGGMAGKLPLVLELPAKAVVLEARLLPQAVPDAPVAPSRPVAAPRRDADEAKTAVQPSPRVAAAPQPVRDAAEEAPPSMIQRATDAPPARTSILIMESTDLRLIEHRYIDVTFGRYYFANEVDVRAGALDDVDPQYPVAALATGLPGRVVIMLYINERGGVDRKETVLAQPPIFEPYAYETIRKVRWAPARRQGEDVKSVLMLDFRYRIDQ